MARCIGLILSLAIISIVQAGTFTDHIWNTLSQDSAIAEKAVAQIYEGGEKAIPDIIEALKSPNSMLVANAAYLLAGIDIHSEMMKRAVRDELQNLVLSGKTNRIKQNAAFALTRNETFSYVEELKDKRFEVFLQFLFDSEFLASLYGLKPVSAVMTPPSLVPFQEFTEIKLNENLEWFQPGHGRVLVIFNRIAIEALLAVREKKAQLESLGFQVVGLSTDQIIEKFKILWSGGLRVDQYSFDVISGLFLGYPLLDVLAYADSAREFGQANGTNRGLFSSLNPDEEGTVFGFYVARKNSSKKAVDEFLSYYQFAFNHYIEQVNSGKTPTQIVSDASLSSKFCEALLQ